VLPAPTCPAPIRKRCAIVHLRLKLVDTLAFKQLDRRLFRLQFLLSQPIYDALYVKPLLERFSKTLVLQQTLFILHEFAVLQPVLFAPTRTRFFAAQLRCAVVFRFTFVFSSLVFKVS